MLIYVMINGSINRKIRQNQLIDYDLLNYKGNIGGL